MQWNIWKPTKWNIVFSYYLYDTTEYTTDLEAKISLEF